MLILNSSDVQYCFVKKQKSGEEKIIPALSYQGKLFVKLKTYAINKIDRAIERCRKILDDERVTTTSIIVKNATGLTVWISQDSQIKETGKKNNSDRAKILAQQQQVTGKKVYSANDFYDLSATIDQIALDIDRNSAQKFRKLISQKLITDRDEALQFLLKIFKETVGPIAEVIYQDILYKYGTVTTFRDLYEFAKLLSAAITCDRVSREKFERLVSQKLITDSKTIFKLLHQAYRESIATKSEHKYFQTIKIKRSKIRRKKYRGLSYT